MLCSRRYSGLNKLSPVELPRPAGCRDRSLARSVTSRRMSRRALAARSSRSDEISMSILSARRVASYTASR